MEKVSIVGLDLAKSIIQVHGASVDGSVLFRRKISSKKLLDFLSKIDPCIVAMEACAGSHIRPLRKGAALLPPETSLFNSISVARSTRGVPMVMPRQTKGSIIHPEIAMTTPVGPRTFKNRPVARSSTRRMETLLPK